MDFASFFLAHLSAAVLTLLGTFLAAFLVWSRHTRSLFGKDFWVVIPFIGKMSEWRHMTMGIGDARAQLTAGASYADKTLTVPAEKALFGYYDDCVDKISRRGFLDAREYLVISGQSGRRPMSGVLWMILWLLTAAEAVGTGLLIAPALSADITEHWALAVGLMIGGVIAIASLFITHGAGEELFVNTLLAAVRNTFRQNQGFRSIDGSRTSDFVQEIGPEHDQQRDAHLEPAARLAARIGATSMVSMRPKYMRILMAIVFILALGVTSAGYRTHVLDEAADQAASGQDIGDDGGPDGGVDAKHLFDTSPAPDAGHVLPPQAVASAIERSSAQTKIAIRADAMRKNLWAVMLLAVIYAFTQVLGVLTGYKYSFFNKNGESAFLKTLGQISYEDFLRVSVHPVAQRTQMRLDQLRARLALYNPGYVGKPFDFMTAYEDSANKATPEPVPTVVVPPQASPARAATLVAAPAPAADDAPDIEAMAHDIVAIADVERRRARASELILRHSLTSAQQAELKAHIQRLKSRPQIDPDLLEAL